MTRKRIVKTYSDTRAKGERTRIEGNRFFVEVKLVSVKVEEEADSLGRTSELYFECGKTKLFDNRTPNNGTINVDRNEVFKPQGGLTLYCEFKEKKGGETLEIPFRVYDQDVGKDDKLINTKLSIQLGQGKEYLSFDENGTKVKISISANRSRF